MILSKGQRIQMAEHTAKLEEANDAFVEAAKAYREAGFADSTGILDAARAWNERLRGAVTFADEVTCEIMGYFDDKSEHWQESERGEAVQSMISAWSNWIGSARGITPRELRPEELANLVPYEDLVCSLVDLPCSPD